MEKFRFEKFPESKKEEATDKKEGGPKNIREQETEPENQSLESKEGIGTKIEQEKRSLLSGLKNVFDKLTVVPEKIMDNVRDYRNWTEWWVTLYDAFLTVSGSGMIYFGADQYQKLTQFSDKLTSELIISAGAIGIVLGAGEFATNVMENTEIGEKIQSKINEFKSRLKEKITGN